jgi:hypothetical protein
VPPNSIKDIGFPGAAGLKVILVEIGYDQELGSSTREAL